MTEEPSQPAKSIFREYVEAIAIALILALFIRTFVVQAFKIPSRSMENTLLVGDHILVNKFIYGIRNPFTNSVLIPLKKPTRNDVIVFRYPLNPSQDYIKRVIGVAGDRIEIINKQVYVNDVPLTEPHKVHKDPNILPPEIQPRDSFGPVTVPEHSLFVMGDNRDNSYDSRFWKFVDLQAIRGKAFIIYWSWDSENFSWAWDHFFSVRWNRFGKMLH